MPHDDTTPASRDESRAAGAGRLSPKQVLKRQRIGGDLAGLLPAALGQHRGKDPKAQIDFLLSKGEFIAASGRRRRVSEATMTAYGNVLRGAMNDLKVIQMPIWRIDSFSRKHAIRLVRYWVEQGHAPKTINNRISHLRVFMHRLGKRDVIPENTEWLRLLAAQGIPLEKVQPRRDNTSRAWDSNGVDFSEVHERVKQEDELVAVQLLLELAFGLRVKETHCITPSMADVGSALILEEGTKGKRRRTVPLDDDPEVRRWQREVIQQAIEMAAKHPQGKLARRGMKLHQAINRYYYVMRKCGVTKKQLGVTSHGLRHQYAQRFFKDRTGLPAPVRGEMPPQDYKQHKDLVKEGMRKTSHATGHWRESVTGAYLSTAAGMSKVARQRISAALNRFQGKPEVTRILSAIGTRELWLGGKVAMGLATRPGEPLLLTALVNIYPERESLKAVAETLQTAVGVPLILMATTDSAHRTQDMAEVILASAS